MHFMAQHNSITLKHIAGGRIIIYDEESVYCSKSGLARGQLKRGRIDQGPT